MVDKIVVLKRALYVSVALSFAIFLSITIVSCRHLCTYDDIIDYEHYAFGMEPTSDGDMDEGTFPFDDVFSMSEHDGLTFPFVDNILFMNRSDNGLIVVNDTKKEEVERDVRVKRSVGCTFLRQFHLYANIRVSVCLYRGEVRIDIRQFISRNTPTIKGIALGINTYKRLNEKWNAIRNAVLKGVSLIDT